MISKKEIDEVALSLVYLIVNIYPVLYIIDENDEVGEETDVSKLIKLEEDIQEICNKVLKLINYEIPP